MEKLTPGPMLNRDGRGFWWQRLPTPKRPADWTPNRLAHARRAVEREAERMPLFPELRRYRTVEERIERADQQTINCFTRLRAGRARMWRDARRYIRTLAPEDREHLRAKWNTRFTPGGPADLFAVARLIGLRPPNPLLEAEKV